MCVFQKKIQIKTFIIENIRATFLRAYWKITDIMLLNDCHTIKII